MRVITRNKLWIDALQKLYGWLIIRVLWNKLTVDGEVKNFGLGLCNGRLQIFFCRFQSINQSEPFLDFSNNSILFFNWRKWN